MTSSRRFFAAAVAALVVFDTVAIHAQQPKNTVPLRGEWVALFNGKDLIGWKIVGKERGVVEDGTIYGESATTNGDGFLKTEKTYKDFDAFLRFKCESPTNSGFFFHSD